MREQVITYLKAYAEQVGKTPSYRAFREYLHKNLGIARDPRSCYGGTWNDLVKAAGLKINKKYKSS
ncbi:homing endonuclease associated repeat-containing protein [Brevibacillus borstelensis]